MFVRRLIVSVTVLSGLAVAGCSSDDPRISVDGARATAGQANQSTCPLHLDAPAALRSAGVGTTVTLESTDVRKSAKDKPADDPVAAARGGMSAIDANAAVYVECDYKSGGDGLEVRVVVTPVKGALNLLLPLLTADAGISLREVEPLISTPPAAGEIKVFRQAVGVGGLAVDGGDGTIMVTSELPDVRDDKLGAVTKELAGQVQT